MQMSANPSQILNDARTLVTRLQERDKMTDSLLRHAQAVTEKINCLKEYKEDLNDLHELRIAQRPRSVLVHNLQQENRQIKILQKENHQLKLALDEHQATLDIIMQRYRQQFVEMIKLNKLQQIADKAIGGVHNNNSIDETNKLVEFARLFDQCLKSGEASSTKDQEELTRLKTENQTLRQLLKIASQNDPTASLRQTLDVKCQLNSTIIETKIEPENEPNTPTNEIAPVIEHRHVIVIDTEVKPCDDPVETNANVVVSPISVSKMEANETISVSSKTVKITNASSSAVKSPAAAVTLNGNHNNNVNSQTTTAKNSRPQSHSTAKRVSLPHVSPNLSTSVKKSASQDSAMFNGVVSSAKSNSNPTSKTTPTTIVKKKSASEIKIGNANVVAANSKPASKSSTTVVKNASTKGASVR